MVETTTQTCPFCGVVQVIVLVERTVGGDHPGVRAWPDPDGEAHLVACEEATIAARAQADPIAPTTTDPVPTV